MSYNPTLWSSVKTLFDYYRIPYQSIMSYPTPTWDVLTEYSGFSEDVNKGKGFRIPTELEPAVGASPTYGTFYPGSRADATHDINKYYASVEEEPETFDLQDREVVDILKTDLDNQPRIIRHNLERNLFGSYTGKIAEVTGTGSGYLTIRPCYCDQTDYPGGADDLFLPGLRYDSYTSNTANTDVGIKVTSVDTTNHRIYGAWTDATTGDFIYYKGAKGLEFYGLYDIIDLNTTSYAGIDPTTYSGWSSYVYDLDGDDLTFKILKDFDSNYYQKNPTKKCTHVLGHPDTTSKYLELYTNNINVNVANGAGMKPNLGSLKPVYTSSYYGELPIIESRMCPPGKLYFINANALHYKIRTPFEWLEGESKFGGVFRHAAVAKSDTLVALGWMRYAVFTTLRNAHAVIKNINTAAGS